MNSLRLRRNGTDGGNIVEEFQALEIVREDGYHVVVEAGDHNAVYDGFTTRAKAEQCLAKHSWIEVNDEYHELTV